VLSQVPPLTNNFALDTSPGAKVGVIGLDFATRRRNRVNGRILSCGENLTVAVEQSFGNCPKYIQTRVFESSQSAPPATLRREARLDDAGTRRILAGADTFFIASRAADPAGGESEGLDVSHRGGLPGFLCLQWDGSLSFPDFSGNRYFNTLGNIASDGRVGLIVPDFTNGDALLLTGRATIDWNPERVAEVKRAERTIDIIPEEIWYVEHALPTAARLVELWPGFNPRGT
jgi:predicted pyridoxine 5'-phosphate oxidase superfamily flavin-nucleotide-binding protein